MAVKLMTGPATASFAFVFKSRKNLSDIEKYSCSLIFSKKDKVSIKAIQDAIDAAVKERWGTKPPKGLKLPLRDGDKDREGEEFVGSVFLNANSDRKPLVIDGQRNPLHDDTEFYSGCKCRAQLSFFAYDRPDSKGIGIGLNGIQKLADGKRLDGAVSAEAFELVDLVEEDLPE